MLTTNMYNTTRHYALQNKYAVEFTTKIYNTTRLNQTLCITNVAYDK